jgi:hypothetical protein
MADDGDVNVAKAKSFLAQADERKKGGWFENLTKSKDKFIEAAELYSKAANFFKLAKKGTLHFSCHFHTA